LYFLLKKPIYKVEKLELFLNDEDVLTLSKLRENALELGHLNRTPNDYVAASIRYQNDSIGGKARLKGDWLDHLGEDKWSFRIKLDTPLKDSLQTFSLQTPKTRNCLDGYVYHQLLVDEGILSNEMRFVELIVNGNTWGIYALEEHLSPRMTTHQGKSEGVILKFNDNSFFNSNNTDAPGIIKQAKIKTYGKTKINKTKVKRAKSILKAYQNQTDSVYYFFDAKQMAMYYALCDLSTAYHAMGWINIRFYYNFDTQLMEPIGYDPYPVLEWGKPYLGKVAQTINLHNLDTKMIVYNALKNENINKVYQLALLKVTSPNYIKSFFERHKTQFDFYEQELQKEFDYNLNVEEFYKRAKEIREN